MTADTIMYSTHPELTYLTGNVFMLLDSGFLLGRAKLFPCDFLFIYLFLLGEDLLVGKSPLESYHCEDVCESSSVFRKLSV